jgi:DNA-binding response OmpR family regulator
VCPEGETRQLAADEQPRTPKILVVDDIADNIDLMRYYLEPSGYAVHAAHNSREALAALRREELDLILLDIMMPGIDGIQLCRILKSHELTRDVPVMMVTAVTQVQDKIRGLEAGADDYITKPFSGAELLARVRAMLRIKALQDEMKLANDKLREALSELKQAQTQFVRSEKLAAIQATVASVNHEINNPLCAISLDVQMLQLELSETDERVMQKLRRIEENVKRIHMVTQRLTGLKDPSSREYLPGQEMLDLT